MSLKLVGIHLRIEVGANLTTVLSDFVSIISSERYMTLGHWSSFIDEYRLIPLDSI